MSGMETQLLFLSPTEMFFSVASVACCDICFSLSGSALKVWCVTVPYTFGGALAVC